MNVDVSQENMSEFEGLMKQNMNSAQSNRPATMGKSREQIAGETGEFNLRDAIGQRFQRQHKPGTKEGLKYSTCSNNSERAEFRAKWAKAEYKDCDGLGWPTTHSAELLECGALCGWLADVRNAASVQQT